MQEDNILKLQDIFNEISNSSSGIIESSFDEITDEDYQDPKTIATAYYEDRYFSQEDTNGFLFALTEMLIDVDEETLGWINEVVRVMEKFQLDDQTSEVSVILNDLFGEQAQVWQINPQRPQDFEISHETGSEEMYGFDDFANDTPGNMTPIDQTWTDFLIKKDDRYFMLHLGSAISKFE